MLNINEIFLQLARFCCCWHRMRSEIEPHGVQEDHGDDDNNNNNNNDVAVRYRNENVEVNSSSGNFIISAGTSLFGMIIFFILLIPGSISGFFLKILPIISFIETCTVLEGPTSTDFKSPI